MERRLHHRNRTEIPVACRYFISDSHTDTNDNTMRNFSSLGTYVESRKHYPEGTILLIRMDQYPRDKMPYPWMDGFRTNALAEVKWIKELGSKTNPLYGIGLRYL